MTQDNLLQVNDDHVELDLNKNYLEELVGEGKKFKDVESLAKGKVYADQTVELYKQRLDELREYALKLREENVARARLEELVDQLGQQPRTSNIEPQVKDVNQPMFDPNQLDTLVSEKVAQIEKNRIETNNYNQVRNKLQEQFGTNYANVLRQRTVELGLSDEDVTALAKKSPTAFFRTMGLEQPQRETYQAPPQSSQRIDNFAPKSGNKRTWSYYEELRKKQPDLYYSSKIGAQMAKDAIELGEDFRDGDYYVPGLHDPE